MSCESPLRLNVYGYHFQTIINVYQPLVKFGLIHVMAANICIWGNTVMMEAVESYVHQFGSHGDEHGNSNHGNDTNEHYVTSSVHHNDVITTALPHG